MSPKHSPTATPRTPRTVTRTRGRRRGSTGDPGKFPHPLPLSTSPRRAATTTLGKHQLPSNATRKPRQPTSTRRHRPLPSTHSNFRAKGARGHPTAPLPPCSLRGQKGSTCSLDHTPAPLNFHLEHPKYHHGTRRMISEGPIPPRILWVAGVGPSSAPGS